MARFMWRATLCCALSVCAAAELAAQNQLRAGVAASGSLTTASQRLSDGRYHADYDYRGTAGERVRIALDASGFDPELVLYSCPSECTEIARDDDGGEGVNSLIETTLPSTGDYVVVVLSHYANGVGTYTLVLNRVAATVATNSSATAVATNSTPSAIVGRLYPGNSVSGRISASDAALNNGRRHQDWQFTGTQGQRLVVDMRYGSFDPELVLYQQQGNDWTEIARDDDGGDGLDARLDVVLPATGEYLICAQTHNAGNEGTYTIAVQSGGGGSSPTGGAVAIGAFAAIPLAFDVPAYGALGAGDSIWTDNTYFDWYTFTIGSSQTVRVEMTSSGFRPYMMIGSLSGGSYSYIKGSTTENGVAVIDIALSAGSYLVRANQFGGSPQPGSYTLTLRRR